MNLASGDRVVVVSPHLDDAVLSLGATIAHAVRRGVPVSVLTVFACDPDSTAPSGGWDARAGFATEGEAARVRRLEDAAACAVVGAEPRWLAFGSVDYERGGAAADVTAAVQGALGDATVALLPGAPLSHPDHAWLTDALTPLPPDGPLLGLYAEQPYRMRAGDPSKLDVPAWLREVLGSRPDPEPISPRPRDWIAKRAAIRRYRSQLPLLALSGGRARLERHLLSELRSGGERVWLVPEGASEGP